MTKVVPLDKFADELRKYSEKSVNDFKVSVVDSLYEYLPQIVAKSPVDTGLYAQSWRVEVTDKNAYIGNFAPYAPIIEFGTRPFTPPLGPLLEWARRVLKKAEIDGDCYALAVGVQKKFQEKGMEPKHILTDSLPEIVENIARKMKEAMK